MSEQGVAAAESWFAAGDDACLIGSRCTGCGSFAFPPESLYCRNPRCASTEFDQLPLSRRGRLWSYAINYYAAPPPALSPEPFEPYSVAAVELEEERMIVLGQVSHGTDPALLHIGRTMQIVVEPIIPGSEELVWKWKPVVE